MEAILHKLLSILPYINIFFAIGIIFLERKNPISTLAWLMVLVLMPIPGLGFIIYLLFGYNPMKEKIFKLKKEEDKVIQRFLLNTKNLFEYTNTFNDELMVNYKDMMTLHLNSSYSIFTENNEVKIFTDGNKKFDSLLQDIKDAKHHVHLLYYIIKNDYLGNRIVNALIEKAKQGVEVRLLYDDVGSRLAPKKAFEKLKKCGGKVSPFFPSILPLINLKINYRNHRKIAIIDNNIGYVGGFNIGDEYLGKDKKFGYWRDTHLRIRGDAVNMLQARFVLDWRYASKENITLNYKYFLKNNTVGNVGIQIVSSGPDSDWQQIKYGYIKMISSAKKSVYIQTPYLVLDESINEALKIAVLSGVDVRIMIPNKPDHPFIYWATLSNIGELLKYGVKAYIYEKGFIHCKTIVVDKKVSSVGTANLDIRSFKLNFEVNSFIYDSNISSELSNIFMKDIGECSELTIEKYNKRSLIIKFKESISRLLSPIL